MASAAVEHSRAIRPFAVTRLLRRVAALHRRTGYLAEVMVSLVEAGPQGPSAWRYELGELSDCVEALIEECHDVKAECVRLGDSADKDWDRALKAMLVILEGIGSDSSPAADPVA